MADEPTDAPQDRPEEKPAPEQSDGQKPGGEKPAGPSPARVPLRQRLRAKFNRAAKSEVAEVLKDTAEDLKTNNKERAGLAIATVIPGGWIAYYAHRHHKYKKKTAENDPGNDNTGEKPAQKKPAPPKP